MSFDNHRDEMMSNSNSQSMTAELESSHGPEGFSPAAMYAPGNAPIGIFDTLLLLASNKRTLLIAALAGALLATGAGLLLPRTYTATAVIMPPQQTPSTAAALLGQLAPLAGVGGADLSLKTPAELYIGLLSSRSIADNIARQFRLDRLYRSKRHSDTLKQLARRSHFSTGKDTLIKIGVDDLDPARSAELANAYVDELYKQTSRLALTESSQRRLFFEGQLAQERAALDKAEADFKAVQEQTGVFQVASQADVLIRSIAALQADIAAREVALANIRSGATERNPEVQRRQTELNSLRAHLRQLEESSRKGSSAVKVAASSQLPQAALEHLKGLRELQYHESLFEMLAKQYEAARIDEAKDAPVIQIVDRAVTPDHPGGLPVPVYTALGALAGAVLAAGVLFFAHAAGSAAHARKLAVLRQTVFSNRRSASAGN